MLNSLNSWFLDPNHSSEVAYIGFWMGLVGVIGTLSGWFFTYRQAKNAEMAAHAAERAVNEFKFRISGHDALRDISEVSYALDTTRRHLNNESWKDAVDTYEDARRAIIRVDLTIVQKPEEIRVAIQKMARQMESFCLKVDAALAEKGPFPDKIKALAVIRKNYELLETLQKSVQEASPA